MKVLDLCCGGGGACLGYMANGFEVTGVDISEQPNYPGTFIMADAIEYLLAHGRSYDFIHASPPCQGYSKHVTSRSSKWNHTLGKDEPRMIALIRAALIATGKPYVIENVVGARLDMNNPIILCGTMFGLPISRHRLFEASFPIKQPIHLACRGVAKEYAQSKGWEYRDMSATGKGRHAGTSDRWREILGIDWPMTQHQLAEAIPPAFTRYIALAMAEAWGTLEP